MLNIKQCYLKQYRLCIIKLMLKAKKEQEGNSISFLLFI